MVIFRPKLIWPNINFFSRKSAYQTFLTSESTLCSTLYPFTMFVLVSDDFSSVCKCPLLIRQIDGFMLRLINNHSSIELYIFRLRHCIFKVIIVWNVILLFPFSQQAREHQRLQRLSSSIRRRGSSIHRRGSETNSEVESQVSPRCVERLILLGKKVQLWAIVCP